MASQPWIPARIETGESGCASFNGAMASQPWIHPSLSTVDTLPNQLQWSHGLPAMDTCYSWPKCSRHARRFNGAMASQPWILGNKDKIRSLIEASMEPWPPSHGYPLRVVSSVRTCGASMEPWPPSHGYTSCVSLTSGCKSCFNGAMASQPWIRPRRRSLRARAGCASMEPWPPSHGYLDAPRDNLAALPASMEPWPPSHGYGRQHEPQRRGTQSFNGAMASQPWIPYRN